MKRPFVLSFLLLLFSFWAAPVHAQTSACPLTAYGDTTLCGSGTVQLNATPGFDTYSWSPSTGLSDPTIPNPVATVSGSTSYILTATTTTNLIYNGDFALGNVGFTSGQTFSSFYTPGDYYVNNSFFGGVFFFNDHTPTSDNMFMSVDGATYPTYLWQANIPVINTATNYDFSFWSTRCDVAAPHWQIHFIGNVTGDVLVADIFALSTSAPSGTWDQYSVFAWNSGPNTSVTIKIVNLELDGYGNDFGLDDFDFHTNCTSTDTVIINTGLITTVSGTTNICPGTNTTLTATGGTSFLWNTGDTTSSITVSPAASTNYTVIGNGGSGCIDTVSVPVTVLSSPSAAIAGNDSLCQGNNVTLSASGGTGYLWSNGSTSTSINVTPAASITYSVIVSNSSGCSDTASHAINVSPYPLPPIVRDTLVCVGSILPPLNATGQHILWYPNVTATIGSNISPVPNTDVAGTYDFFATQTVNGCESSKANATVEVLAPPFVTLPDSLVLCEGDSLSLGPITASYASYTWSDTISGPVRTVVTGGLYVLTASNHCGVTTDSCEVRTELCDCNFYIPNAFTPNADGMNDLFRPVYSCGFETYSFMIFNRWGELIYSTENPDEGWDATYKNRPAQQDVYVYVVRYTGEAGIKPVTKEYRGHFTLLR